MMTRTNRPDNDLRYELTIRTAGLHGFAALALLIGALAVVAPALVGATTRSLAVGSFCGLALIAVAGLLWREARRAHILRPQPITLHSQFMVLPRGRYHQDAFQVQYDRVRNVRLNAAGAPRLTIELWEPGASEQFAYSEKDFASTDDLFAMLEALRRRLTPHRQAA
ncbi:MAG: hypothetical protein U1E76_09545 [Planctomycetota bacterium]